MPGDREDLRRRVNELEATVQGLTQELVEANERIRTLEGRAEESEADRSMAKKGEESKEGTDRATEEQEGEENDIIVA